MYNGAGGGGGGGGDLVTQEFPVYKADLASNFLPIYNMHILHLEIVEVCSWYCPYSPTFAGCYLCLTPPLRTCTFAVEHHTTNNSDNRVWAGLGLTRW